MNACFPEGSSILKTKYLLLSVTSILNDNNNNNNNKGKTSFVIYIKYIFWVLSFRRINNFKRQRRGVEEKLCINYLFLLLRDHLV